MSNIIQFVKRGSGMLDDDEQAQASANLEAHYAEELERLENGRSASREYEPEAFAALADYLARKDGPTQNAEGVHVGDLFYASWGWEQTNIDYFQVVALKGAHTAVLRQIGRDYIGGFSYSGKCRPMRDHFIDDEQYTVRTKKSDYYKDGRVEMKAPHISAGHLLHATSDFDEHDYSSYA